MKLKKAQKQLYADVLCEECVELFTQRQRRTAFKLLEKLPKGTFKIFSNLDEQEFISLPTCSEKYPYDPVPAWMLTCSECGNDLKNHEMEVGVCDDCRQKLEE